MRTLIIMEESVRTECRGVRICKTFWTICRESVVHEHHHPRPSHKCPHLESLNGRPAALGAGFLGCYRNLMRAAAHVLPGRAKRAKRSDGCRKMCDLNVTFVGFCLERGKREGLLPFSNLVTLCGFYPVNMLRFGAGFSLSSLPP